ncbi:MAG: LON peptidase substrate-binding domain-containing protein [Ktedonobacterales bacterium]
MDNQRRPRRSRARERDLAGETLFGDSTLAGDGETRGVERDLAVLPVRNTVLLPHMVVPLFVDREPALRAIEYAMAHDRTILIVTQRSEHVTDPLPQDVFLMGTECVINRVMRLNDGAANLVAQGVRRFRIHDWLPQTGFGRAPGPAGDPFAVAALTPGDTAAAQRDQRARAGAQDSG